MATEQIYCTKCHAWVAYADTPSGRHEHAQSIVRPKMGTQPKVGTNAHKVLSVMIDHPGWWSTWDLVPHTQSVHVRDFIRELKHLGWTFDERTDTTPAGKRYKSWKLIVPSQGGLF